MVYQIQTYAAYRVLTKNANEEDIKTVAQIGMKDPLIREYSKKLLEFIDSKNPSIIQKIIGGEKEVGRTLMEIMKPQIDVVIDTTRRNDLFDYVFDGGMTVDYAAKRAGLTPEQFKKEMDAYEKNKQHLQTV